MQKIYDDEQLLSEHDLEKALSGSCPLCPVGLVIGTKIKDETDVWKLRCDRCNFLAYVE